jgi:deoxyuridine 5'-triphosphate nucleotidohydrolase
MSSHGVLYFKRLSTRSLPPIKATHDSAGFDLASAENVLIAPGERKLVSTDLQIVLPAGTYGRICDRSGLAFHEGICVLAGTIDSDYSGVIKILIINYGEKPFQIWMHDRIAQMIPEKIAYPKLKEVLIMERSTQRHDFGFGSTGLR